MFTWIEPYLNKNEPTERGSRGTHEQPALALRSRPLAFKVFLGQSPMFLSRETPESVYQAVLESCKFSCSRPCSSSASSSASSSSSSSSASSSGAPAPTRIALQVCDHSTYRPTHLRRICPELVRELPELLFRRTFCGTPFRSLVPEPRHDDVEARQAWAARESWPRHPSCQCEARGRPTNRSCTTLTPHAHRFISVWADVTTQACALLDEVVAHTYDVMLGEAVLNRIFWICSSLRQRLVGYRPYSAARIRADVRKCFCEPSR